MPTADGRDRPVRIRPPIPADAPALAALAGELGYPTSAEELTGRLAALQPTDSAGVGAELLDSAERWARARGCRRLVVATRITRERAHRFYEREGYAVAKTSYFLTKNLD